MIRKALLASVVLVGGCATVSSAPVSSQTATRSSPAPGLSQAQVAQGFADAIVLGCAAAAEAGKPISEIAGTAIVRDDDRPPALKPRNGGTAWAPASAKGIVMIDEGAAECEVLAYGPPAQATLNAAGEALAAKGFAVSSPMQPSGGIFFVTYSKQAGGRTVSVRLSGNDPGAPGMFSRFSTLGARISAK